MVAVLHSTLRAPVSRPGSPTPGHSRRLGGKQHQVFPFEQPCGRKPLAHKELVFPRGILASLVPGERIRVCELIHRVGRH